jgi:uncharacterized membrane protein
MHPIAYSAAYQEEDRNRLTVFFRLLVALPWFFVALFWGLAAWLAVIGAWFALLFTGRYPQGLYDFNANFLRFITRVNGFVWLLTDEWPSFSGDDEPSYPVRLHIDPPKEEYSRAKVFFRIILMIPVYILSYVMSIILQVVGFIAWLVMIFTGKLPAGLYKPLRIATAYNAKALGYYMLLTEDFPPFWMDEEEEAPRFLASGGTGGAPGLTTESSTPAGQGPLGT